MKNKKIRVFFLILFMLVIFFSFACKKKTNNQIESVEQIKSGSYIIGTPYLTYCQEQAPIEFPNAKDYKSYNDMTAAYLALQQGKIDVLIQDETMARVEISNGVDGVKIIDEKLDITCNLGVGIYKDSELVNENIINAIISNLIDNNIINDMKNRWIVNANYDIPNIELPTDDVPTLKIATAGNVEPFSFYKNGEVTGFDIELAKRIAQSLNMKVSFEINPDFDSLIASVQSGKSDLLISDLYITEERKSQMPLSIPYRTTYGVVVVKDYSNSSYTSLEELQNKKIGYESSSTQFSNQLKKYLPNVDEVLFNNTTDALAALQRNRIDGLITDLPNAKFIENTTDGFKILPEYLDEDNYGFIFQKGSSLTNEFNEILQKYKETNVLSELEDKWFSDLDNPNKEMMKQDKSKSYKKTIKAISSAIIQPMAYLNSDNEVIGFEAEIIVKVCEELNYYVEFLPTVGDIGSVMATLETGHADLAFNTISITEERKEKYDFSIPYYEGAAVILIKNNETSNITFFEKLANSFNKTFIVEQRWKMILDGILITLIISLFCGVIGLLLGFGLCLLRRGNNKPLNGIIKAIVKIIQGTPIVVFLMIMYYIVFGKIDISAIIVAIFAFGINFGIYASEIMRSGFETIDIGQEEAARAMGYSRVQTFWKISFPQAAKKFLPVLRGEFISMVKMTSIAGYISVAELTRVGDIIRSKTMEAFFPLIAIALIYFGLAELLTFGLTILEKNLDSKNKPFKFKRGVKNE